MQTILITGVPKILCRVPLVARVPLVRHPCSRQRERTDLTQVLRKKEFSDSKAIALETINIRYPQHDWLISICIDGSRLDQDGSAGTGIYTEQFAFYLNLGPKMTPFDRAVEAIRTTIQQLLLRKEAFENDVIFSNSISAIQAVTSLEFSDSIRIKNCTENLGLLLTLKKNIIFSMEERRLSERLLSGTSNIRTSSKDSLKNARNKLWSDLEDKKDFNDDHRGEITDFVHSIPRFQECHEDVET
ncbi:hypothetical protein TNCV_3561321 [Trichonephila clavipes]|nr:hypothetical protein TNCV_3561321 [Trichonephila clavipes]